MSRFIRSAMLIAVSTAFIASIPMAKVDGGSTINLRTDERKGSAKTVVLYRVDATSKVVYRLDEESAQDAVLAFAMRDEVATICLEEVPAADVGMDSDGFIYQRHRAAA